MHKHIHNELRFDSESKPSYVYKGPWKYNSLAACLNRRTDTSKRRGVGLHIDLSERLVAKVSHEYDPKRKEPPKDILTAEIAPWSSAV
jgi:hypothetical protein